MWVGFIPPFIHSFIHVVNNCQSTNRAYEASLEALEILAEELHLGQPTSPSSSFPSYLKALKLCNQALAHASRAQTDHALLPPAFFPSEHYAAVFLPLILPLIVPLILGLVSEWKRYKEKIEKKKKKKKKKKGALTGEPGEGVAVER